MTEDQNSQGISSLSSLQTKIKQETKGNKHFSAREGNSNKLSIERPIYEQYIYSEKEIKEKKETDL